MLAQVKECLRAQSEAWARTAAKRKGIADDSPLIGEEWLSVPYTVMGCCNQMMATLGRVKGKEHLKGVPLRELPSGQIAARVLRFEDQPTYRIKCLCRSGMCLYGDSSHSAPGIT